MIGIGDIPMDEHRRLMRLAIDEARKAECAGEVPTGCVIVEPDADGAIGQARILGRGRNSVEASGNPTAHAEMMAISEACNVRGDFRLDGTILYVTKEPCAMCAGAIVLARIPIVVWGMSDPARGGQSAFGILDSEALINRSALLGGVCGEECLLMMQAFFRARRTAAK